MIKEPVTIIFVSQTACKLKLIPPIVYPRLWYIEGIQRSSTIVGHVYVVGIVMAEEANA